MTKQVNIRVPKDTADRMAELITNYNKVTEFGGLTQAQVIKRGLELALDVLESELAQLKASLMGEK